MHFTDEFFASVWFEAEQFSELNNFERIHKSMRKFMQSTKFTKIQNYSQKSPKLTKVGNNSQKTVEIISQIYSFLKLLRNMEIGKS